jgi:hypothetical protein
VSRWHKSLSYSARHQLPEEDKRLIAYFDIHNIRHEEQVATSWIRSIFHRIDSLVFIFYFITFFELDSQYINRLVVNFMSTQNRGKRIVSILFCFVLIDIARTDLVCQTKYTNFMSSKRSVVQPTTTLNTLASLASRVLHVTIGPRVQVADCLNNFVLLAYHQRTFIYQL